MSRDVVDAAKRQLRREMDALRKSVEVGVRLDAGRAVMRHVLESGELTPGRRVALYAALPDELPTDGLMELLLRHGHPVLLPRASHNDRLEFARIADRRALVVGRFGALEPPPESPPEALRVGDLVLVPGMAFDRRGGRLGRGGGWYDRSLPPSPLALFGIGYAFQIADSIPMTARDRRVLGVFTERGLEHCSSQEWQRDPG